MYTTITIIILDNVDRAIVVAVVNVFIICIAITESLPLITPDSYICIVLYISIQCDTTGLIPR